MKKPDDELYGQNNLLWFNFPNGKQTRRMNDTGYWDRQLLLINRETRY